VMVKQMNEQTKTCSRCGRELPATTEYFTKGNARFGLQSWCKECTAEHAREYYQANRENVLGRAREYRQNNCEKIREYNQEYYQTNREELNKRQQEYRQNNKEKVVGQRRKSYQNTKKYYQKYRQKNREKVLANTRNYRARLLGAEGFHTAHDIMKKYRLQGGRCFYCGCDLNYKFHVDHFYPLSKGGSNDPSNLVIACPTCNLSKDDRLPEEFIASLPNRVWS